MQKTSLLSTDKTSMRLLELCQSPYIYSVESFLNEHECNHLIDISRAKLVRSQGYDLDSGQNKETEIRTSWNCWLYSSEDPFLKVLEQRIENLTGIPRENGEELSVLRYEIGQQYKAHHDYFDPIYPGSESALSNGGQRVATVLLYLSNVEEGGETEFPLINISVKPQKGSALVFTNVCADGTLDRNSFHAGLPVAKGEKWIATKWLREKSRF